MLAESIALPAERQEIAIIGGGLSSLSFASQLLYSSGALPQDEIKRLLSLSSLPEHNLRSVCIISSGPSIAYESAPGHFSEWLTLSGSDDLSRENELVRMRSRIKEEFAARGFRYCEGSTVTEICETDDGAFQLRVTGEYGSQIVEAERLAIALGHSLREIPERISDYVIRGAGDLCARLNSHYSEGVSNESCLAKVFKSYRPDLDGVMRIGLVGVGMSFVEVVKILEGLLVKPSLSNEKYGLTGSGVPVELVVYSPRLTGEKRSWRELCRAVEQGLMELPPVYSGPHRNRDEDRSKEYKELSVERIRRLGLTDQIRLVPRRFEWNMADENNGFVDTNVAGDGPRSLSCIIDCSPFSGGLNSQKASLLRGLEAVTLVEGPQGEWSATLLPQAKSKIALLGAAFTPRREWNETHWNGQATRALIDFYPPQASF